MVAFVITECVVMRWNVNGMLDRIKRSTALCYIKRVGPAVVLLQETHLLGTKCSFLGRYGYDEVFHSRHTRGSRGTAILVHRSLPLAVLGSLVDSRGCFVLVWGTIEGRVYNFVSVYVPPQLHVDTLRRLGEKILALLVGITVIGGDFNAVLGRELDSSSGGVRKGPGGDIQFQAWMQSLGLCDAWHSWNPGIWQ